MRWLSPSLSRQLDLETAPLRKLVTQLAARRPVERLAALDGVPRVLFERGEVRAEAERLIPYLMSLATAPSYPEAGALLGKVAQLQAVIDHPPRRLSGGTAPEHLRRMYDAVAIHGRKLLSVARRSAGPTARLAAMLAARHPELDEEVEPLLLALTSGAGDPEERARLYYALARIQLARGAPLHRRLAEALVHDGPMTERLAVALALFDSGATGGERERLSKVIADTAATIGEGATDPRAWGRRFDIVRSLSPSD